MDEEENKVVCRMNPVGCQQHKLGARGSTPRGIINMKIECRNRNNDECRMYDRKKKKTKTSLWIAGYGSLHGRAVNWGVFGGEDDGTGRHGRDPAAELRLGLELDLGLGLGMGVD